MPNPSGGFSFTEAGSPPYGRRRCAGDAGVLNLASFLHGTLLECRQHIAYPCLYAPPFPPLGVWRNALFFCIFFTWA